MFYVKMIVHELQLWLFQNSLKKRFKSTMTSQNVVLLVYIKKQSRNISLIGKNDNVLLVK